MSKPVIKVLDSAVADRIAAGEVVERPASIVKELIENALDAGATHLELDLEEGGVKCVRLRDDGEGMSEEDLALSVRSHATSKISGVEDLFKIASFGFRGEALPSIVSVSETSIVSRRQESETGARLESSGGEEVRVVPAGGPVGTTVEVRNLFFNVPARRKFLKQERTELSHCLEAVTRLLLPEPQVSVRVSHNGNRVLDIHADDDLRGRVRTFFGKKMAEPLLLVEAESGSTRLSALIGTPEMARASTRHQYLFINGRFVRDRSLAFAIKDAYRGLIMPKEHPVAYVFLELDPAQIDINVHPTKTEVRFRNRDQLFSLIRRAVKDALLAEPGARALKFKSAAAQSTGTVAPKSREDLLQTLQHELLDQPRTHDSSQRTSAPEVSIPSAEALPMKVAEGPAPGFSLSPGSVAPGHAVRGTNPCRPRRGFEPVPRAESLDPSNPRFVQVHRSYIIVESPEGIHIVDQHALHERKLYEELLMRFELSEGEDQHLLVPEVVDLGAADQAILLDKVEALADLGLVIEPFGGTSVCVRTLPAQLQKLGGEALITDILEILHEEGAKLDRRELLLATAAQLACRAAVKFNDSLPEAEVVALLAWSERNPLARNCPHGRPVSIAVTLKDLENQFLRKK